MFSRMQRLAAMAIRIVGAVLALSVILLAAVVYQATGKLMGSVLLAAIAYGALMFYLAKLLDQYRGSK